MVSRRGAKVGVNQKPQLGFFFTAPVAGVAGGTAFAESVAFAVGAAGATLAEGRARAAALDALGCGAWIVARGAALGIGAGSPALALGSAPA